MDNKPLFTGQQQQKPDEMYAGVEQLIYMCKTVCPNANGMLRTLSYADKMTGKRFKKTVTILESIDLHNSRQAYDMPETFKYIKGDLEKYHKRRQEQLDTIFKKAEAAYEKAWAMLGDSKEFDEELLRKALWEYFNCLNIS